MSEAAELEKIAIETLSGILFPEMTDRVEAKERIKKACKDYHREQVAAKYAKFDNKTSAVRRFKVQLLNQPKEG